MGKQTSVLTQSTKLVPQEGRKPSSQGKFTMSCKAFCCFVFFTGAILSFILSTILLFGVQNYHKADPVKIYEVFETPNYALTNQLLDNTKYLILYGQAKTGILNFIEHEANLRVIEGKPVVIRQLDENIIKKHMKETKHFVEMYLGQVGRGHHSWFILLNDTETPSHEIQSLQKKYPHDSIVLITPKKLEIEGFTTHKFPALKSKQLKEFMQKDLDMDKKEIKQILDQSASKDIPDIFTSYKNYQQAKIRQAEEAERIKRQQQEEQRRLKEEQERRKQQEAQAALQSAQQEQQTEQKSTKSKKGSKKSKGKTPKSKKQQKVKQDDELKAEEEQEKVQQKTKSKKSQKKSKSQTKKGKKSDKQPAKQVQKQEVQPQNEQENEDVTKVPAKEEKVTKESKKGKSNKNKKVKQIIKNVPEQVKVQHELIEQIKIEIPEEIEPVVIDETKQQQKQVNEQKVKGKKSKKGKKGNKKSKDVVEEIVPQATQAVETVVPAAEEIVPAETEQQPEIAVQTEPTVEQQQVVETEIQQGQQQSQKATQE